MKKVKDYKSSNQYSWTYQRWWVLGLIVAILPITWGMLLLEPRADVSALYEVYVLFVVTAWPHQDTQKVQIVTQVLDERRPHTTKRRGRNHWKETNLFETLTEIALSATLDFLPRWSEKYMPSSFKLNIQQVMISQHHCSPLTLFLWPCTYTSCRAIKRTRMGIKTWPNSWPNVLPSMLQTMCNIYSTGELVCKTGIRTMSGPW